MDDERVLALTQQNEALKAQLHELIELAKGAPIGSNVCLCGEEMDTHSVMSDHTPIDIWDHAFSTFLKKHGLANGVEIVAQNELAYTDPESPNPDVDNRLHQVSGLQAAKAYNDLCQMLGGQYPDCRIQEEAPKAHRFFMNFFITARKV